MRHGRWILLVGLLAVVVMITQLKAQRRITLTTPTVADARPVTFFELMHIQVDFRVPEVVLTVEGEGNVKQQFEFTDSPAVLDEEGVEVTPAVTDGTDMIAMLFPGGSLRAFTQQLITRGKLEGTVDP